MAKSTKKLQLLTEILSEKEVLQLIAKQLGQFVVIGPEEPENGPCIWFDTNTASSDTETAVYLVLGEDTDESDVSVEIDDTEYSVLNTDAPVIADDGSTVAITVSE